MIRTVVCEKEGCNGSRFYIRTENGNLYMRCKECGEEYCYDVSYYNYTMLSSCSNCNNDLFKIFKDTDREGIYAKCSECGNPPEKIYIDGRGIQVTYEQKKLDELANMIYKIDEKVNAIEDKLQSIKIEQDVLEESMAYINQFLTSK